jgi:hypothetical protein
MKTKKIKQNIFLFGVIFILFFIKMMLTGNIGRISYGPISFKETIEKIPEIFVYSVALLILGNIIERNTNKSEEKAIEAARKRIGEREKKEQLEKKDSIERGKNDQIKES